MLRVLSKASRPMHGLHAAATAGLPRALATKKPVGPQPRDPNRVRGDSDYVKRRRAYRQEMHKFRVALQKQGYEHVPRAVAARRGDKDSVEVLAARAERAERKRVSSEARQDRGRELLEETRVRKLERVAYKKRDWEEMQRVLVAKRAADLQMVVQQAGEWVREETLDEHVERAVDAFFIAGEQEGSGVKVVGWK